MDEIVKLESEMKDEVRREDNQSQSDIEQTGSTSLTHEKVPDSTI
jgi:hypothetical protein